jgi:lactate dehydrogenase-like 2-hydroxyacid dehydrogenase
MKVYVFDPLWPNLITSENKALLDNAGVEVILTTEIKPLSECKDLFMNKDEKILAVNPDYVDWSLPSDKFKNIHNLKCIITESTSYGWIDTKYAAEQNIPVVNIRNFSTDAVADWAVMMMMNLMRKVSLLIKQGFPLNFSSDFQTYQGMNLKNKKVGIIGLGNIGTAISERCKGLGMDVSYCSKHEKKTNLRFSDVKTIFETCDVVFPCMADNDETRRIITDDMLKSMNPRSILVSITHAIYNHELVLKLVSDYNLFGYGFEAPPLSFNNYKGNVWACPAYAWCTDGSMRKSMDLFVDAIVNAVKNSYPNQVN